MIYFNILEELLFLKKICYPLSHLESPLSSRLYSPVIGNPGEVEIYLNNVEEIKDHQGMTCFFLGDNLAMPR